MLLGASETVSIDEGDLKIGTWQSIIMVSTFNATLFEIFIIYLKIIHKVELDGPRDRKIAVSVIGKKPI